LLPTTKPRLAAAVVSGIAPEAAVGRLAAACAELPKRRFETVAQVGGNWPSFAFYRQEAMVKDLTQADMVLTSTKRSAEFANWETLAKAQGMTVLRRPLQDNKP
jgi:hypothetical protein